MYKILSVFCFLFISYVSCFPDPGQWSQSVFNESVAIFGAHKPLYAGSSIHITVNCEPHQKIELQWVLRQTSCFAEYLESSIYITEVLKQYFVCPMSSMNSFSKIRFFKSDPVIIECSNRIHLELVNSSFLTISNEMDIPFECRKNFYTSTDDNKDIKNDENIPPKIPSSQETHPDVRENINGSTVLSTSGTGGRSKRSIQSQDSKTAKENFADINYKNESISDQTSFGRVYGSFSSSNVKLGSKLTSVDMDGIYLFILKIESVDKQTFNISVDIGMKGDYGYLSAVDYPLLIVSI
ncbi:transmembrane protein 87A [Caerostris darwini]|uniref:Transmembrane protein 87A n=1 Tax=Caerostris darwini TaxID=1538125 RepID=A0AAV4RK14_9ARAC|nr:transmembrane protein 87A [Caerostris darwini]